MCTAVAVSHVLQYVRQPLAMFSVGSVGIPVDPSHLVTVRLIFSLRHHAVDVGRALSNISIASDAHP